MQDLSNMPSVTDGGYIGVDFGNAEKSAEQNEAMSLHRHIYECGISAVNMMAEMGKALKLMRDKKLYKVMGYETFGEYVEKNGDYSFKERQAYSYIRLAENYTEAFLQSNADIGVTKLELLTRLGEQDRAELLEGNDLAGMTVDEVKQLIKDKQALGEQISFFEAEIKKLKDMQKKKLDDVKAEYQSKLSYSEFEKKSLEEERAKLKEKLNTGTPDERRVALKVYFKETQNSVQRFVDEVNSLEDAETKEKFTAGTVKWLRSMADELEAMKESE